jgi:hypothetical protein
MSSLTRHFYALDEVHAALQYSSTRNDHGETVFWCYELLCSGYASEAISTLFESWLWHKGSFSLSWLSIAEQLASDEVNQDDILLATYQLSAVPYHRRDHSLWNILVLSAANTPPDRVTPKTPPYLPSTDEKEVYMVRAIFQGKAYSAWWISRHLPHERVWELLRWYIRYMCPMYSEKYDRYFTLLEKYETLLGYQSEEYDTVIRCMAVLSVCLNIEQQEKSFIQLPSQIDTNLQNRIHDWDTELGRKVHRRYTIPTACLYGKTIRGQMKWSESTVSHLGHMEQCWKGCPFWDEALQEYQTQKNTWISDDTREAFYDRYLLDDIPDEWTKSEKQKSHGDGIMSPTDKANLSVYSRRFFSSLSRFAWHTFPIIQICLDKKEGIDPLDVIKWFPPPVPIMDNILQPVHRRVYVQ